jgi:hypothetical protein
MIFSAVATPEVAIGGWKIKPQKCQIFKEKGMRRFV